MKLKNQQKKIKMMKKKSQNQENHLQINQKNPKKKMTTKKKMTIKNKMTTKKKMILTKKNQLNQLKN